MYIFLRFLRRRDGTTEGRARRVRILTFGLNESLIQRRLLRPKVADSNKLKIPLQSTALEIRTLRLSVEP